MSFFTFVADTASATTTIVNAGEAIYEWEIPWTRMLCDFRMQEKANMCFEVEHEFEGSEFAVFIVNSVLGSPTVNDGSNLFGLDSFPPLYIRSNLKSGNFSSRGYCDVLGLAYVPEVLINPSPTTVSTVPNALAGAWSTVVGKYRARKNFFKSDNITNLLKLRITVTTATTAAISKIIGVSGFGGVSGFCAKGLHRFKFTEIPV